MHYPRTAFSADNVSETITPTDSAAVIGQRTGLSPLDIAAANSLIQSDAAAGGAGGGATARLDPNTAIVVVLPHVAGEVKTVDGQTVTVTQRDGTTATIHVDGDTTYLVNGVAGTLSDIKVGSFIAAEGTQRADGSLDAAAIRSGFRGHDGNGGPGFPDHDGLGVPNASPAPSDSAG